MKILFLIHYPPPVHGSAVVGGFIKDSTLLNSAFKCRFINLGTSETVEDIGRNSIKKLLRYISLIWQVKKQLLTHRPDLCYFTPTASGSGFYKDALVIAMVKLFGIKTIFHYHNKGVSSRQEHLFDNFLYRMAFKNTRVILLSKNLYQDIQKYVPESRVYYCPNGIPDLKGSGSRAQGAGLRAQGTRKADSGESEKGYSVIGNQYSVSKSEKLITKNPSVVEFLFLSHLIESKGVFVLVDALKILKDKGLAFHCTMIGGEGDVSEKDLKERIGEGGIGEYVEVAGKKYGKEKQNAFEEVDILVHPTFNDCMPLVLLEAMQLSIPIVSTPEGGIPDVVDDGVTGFLVPQRDAAALADKLEVLIKDPDLRVKMRVAGRAKYEREFTLEKFEHRMKEILEEVGSD